MKKKKMFKKEESIKIMKTLGLITANEENQKYIIMTEESITQVLRLENIGETRNYLTE